MQLVLDTNVWIDWLVFDDPSIAPLKAARRAGRIQIVASEACIDELNTVLAYPEFGLDDTQQADHLAEFARCTIRHDDQQPARAVALPRCSDPDDQKFLELARDTRADWLITRDKALLKLGRKTMQVADFGIRTPEQWACASNPG